jgi:hypothetical protein
MIRFALYIVVSVSVVMLASSCGNTAGDLPPLDETFSRKDKNPFGAFVLHNQLGQLYYHNSVRDITVKFENTWHEISDTASVYINISRNLFLSKGDLSAMLGYVYNGNSLFIASDNIDQQLLDTLGCKITGPFPRQFVSEMRYTSVAVSPRLYEDSSAFRYFYLPFFSHFTKMDSVNSRVLGSNRAGANYLLVFYGKGRFYLHLEPRALSNYFLLQKNNYRYLQQVFAFTPAIPEHVYWDDYYNKRNYRRSGQERSSFGVLMQYPAMAWAFWLLLILSALYILFGGKRRQRIVPAIPGNVNTTVTFTETIGRLYLQKKDNRNIADKLITYFLEHIRNQYFLNTSHVNDDFIATLSRKSNNSAGGTQKLFGSIHDIQQSYEVTDEDLLLLNRQIESFYKYKL